MNPPVSRRFAVLVFFAVFGAQGCSPAGGGGGSGGAPGTGGATPGSGGATSGSGGTTPGSGGAGTGSGSGGAATGGATSGSGGASSGGGGVASGGRSGTGGAATGGSSGSSGGTTGGSGGGAGSAAGGRGGSGGAASGGSAGGGSAGGGSGPSSSGLPTPPGAGGIAKPSGTPGALTILPWAGFKAAISYTFDDTNSSQIERYADLNGLGVPLTFYLITNKTTEFNNAVWVQAVKDGHELANHTRSHQNTGTGADVDAGAADIKQKFGVDVWTMAAPYGDNSYVSLASTRYLINRGVNNGLMGPNDNTDPFNIYCFVPAPGAPASVFNGQIDEARSAGKWKTILVHGFTGGSDGAYQPVAIGEFTSSVKYAKGLGDVWIDTVANVGAYWRAQKTLSAVTPTTSGTAKTWTWTLPAHFPPKKFLRVKVDGGTLTQGGAALRWNDHGYYEISLDAGSVTLAQ